MEISIIDGDLIASSDRLADLIWETDPAIFGFIFGDLAVWRQLFPHEWTALFSIQQGSETRLAIVGDRVVGLVNDFAGIEVSSRFSVTMERQLASLDARAGRQLKAAYEAMEWLFPRVPDDALYIMNIVVEADIRRQDLGRRLIVEAATKARRLGLRALHLDTATNNPAVQFYQRVGFRPVVESRAMSLADGVKLPNHFRMVMDI